MKIEKRRLLATMLTIAMVMSLLPMTVLQVSAAATDVGDESVAITGITAPVTGEEPDDGTDLEVVFASDLTVPDTYSAVLSWYDEHGAFSGSHFAPGMVYSAEIVITLTGTGDEFDTDVLEGVITVVGATLDAAKTVRTNNTVLTVVADFTATLHVTGRDSAAIEVHRPVAGGEPHDEATTVTFTPAPAASVTSAITWYEGTDTDDDDAIVDPAEDTFDEYTVYTAVIVVTLGGTDKFAATVATPVVNSSRAYVTNVASVRTDDTTLTVTVTFAQTGEILPEGRQEANDYFEDHLAVFALSTDSAPQTLLDNKTAITNAKTAFTNIQAEAADYPELTAATINYILADLNTPAPRFNNAAALLEFLDGLLDKIEEIEDAAAAIAARDTFIFNHGAVFELETAELEKADREIVTAAITAFAALTPPAAKGLVATALDFEDTDELQAFLAGLVVQLDAIDDADEYMDDHDDALALTLANVAITDAKIVEDALEAFLELIKANGLAALIVAVRHLDDDEATTDDMTAHFYELLAKIEKLEYIRDHGDVFELSTSEGAANLVTTEDEADIIAAFDAFGELSLEAQGMVEEEVDLVVTVFLNDLLDKIVEIEYWDAHKAVFGMKPGTVTIADKKAIGDAKDAYNGKPATTAPAIPALTRNQIKHLVARLVGLEVLEAACDCEELPPGKDSCEGAVCIITVTAFFRSLTEVITELELKDEKIDALIDILTEKIADAGELLYDIVEISWTVDRQEQEECEDDDCEDDDCDVPVNGDGQDVHPNDWWVDYETWNVLDYSRYLAQAKLIGFAISEDEEYEGFRNLYEKIGTFNETQMENLRKEIRTAVRELQRAIDELDEAKAKGRDYVGADMALIEAVIGTPTAPGTSPINIRGEMALRGTEAIQNEVVRQIRAAYSRGWGSVLDTDSIVINPAHTTIPGEIDFDVTAQVIRFTLTNDGSTIVLVEAEKPEDNITDKGLEQVEIVTAGFNIIVLGIVYSSTDVKAAGTLDNTAANAMTRLLAEENAKVTKSNTDNNKNDPLWLPTPGTDSATGGFFINLTNETLEMPMLTRTFPSTGTPGTETFVAAKTETMPAFRVTFFSLDGGNKWRQARPNTFDAKGMAKLLNKGMTLTITNAPSVKGGLAPLVAEVPAATEGGTPTPAVPADVITFQPTGDRQRMVKIAVNFAAGTNFVDATGATPGRWTLTEKGSTDQITGGLQIALPLPSNVRVAGQYGRFAANGIAVLETTGARPVRSQYFVRVAPDATELRAASRPRRINVTSALAAIRAPKTRTNKEGVITLQVRRGWTYVRGTGNAVTVDANDTLTVTKGEVFRIWTTPTERRPASNPITFRP